MAEQKSLKEIIQERKKQYQESIQKTLDEVYQSGNVATIERFENAVLYLGRLAEGNLEGRIEDVQAAQRAVRPEAQRTTGQDRRPRLTFYQYAKAKNEGMTTEEIKNKFRYDSGKQIGAYAANYAKNAKKQQAKQAKKRLDFQADDSEGMKNEACRRLQELRDSGKESINSAEFMHVLGYTSSERPSILSRSPEMSGYVERRQENGKNRIYFKPEGIMKYISARTPTQNGWMLTEGYRKNKKAEQKAAEGGN